jgi:hypothetical protein
MSVPEHVEYPTAWLDAKAARIKANANTTRRRKLLAAIEGDSEHFRCWLLDTLPADLEALRVASQAACDANEDDANVAERVYQKAWSDFRKRYGPLPEFLRESMQEWGGLTDGQLAFARRKFAEQAKRAEGRDEAENARRASAPHWQPGRQSFVGTVQSVRVEEIAVAFHHSATVVKGLVTLDDGRKLWTSLPKDACWIGVEENDMPRQYEELKGMRLEMTATIEVSEDDPTMAFGKRPALGAAKPKKERKPRASTTPTPEPESPAQPANEPTSDLFEAWKAGATIAELVKQTGRSRASIRAELTKRAGSKDAFKALRAAGAGGASSTTEEE